MHQDSRERTPPFTDETGPIPDEVIEAYGPLRRAPRYYAGTHLGLRRMLHADMERNPNGSVPGIRDKAARRIIRKAFAARVSRVGQGLNRARALKAQAREVVHDEHYEKSSSAQMRRARRLFAAEMAILQPVYVPDQKQLRAMRTKARAEKRAGKKDFITAAIEQIVEKQNADA